MKVLITGATGTIGGAMYRHCLQHPAITSIVTLTRRPFPSSDPKSSNIVVSDFKIWPADILSQIADADAIIWALGSSDANEDTNYNYIIAFQEAFRRVMPVIRANRFRYILLSGALVEPDQDKRLYLLSAARKLKGRAETWSLDFAQQHKDVWQTFIVKPGGVATAKTSAVARVAVGVFMPMIRDEQLGAFTADLLVHGNEPEGRVLNERMVQKGTELLQTRRLGNQPHA
jgi:nucleoside-diphosphate-sugar epimerase